MNEENEFEELTPWLVIIITLLGGWLRALHLGAKGMWLDETFSVWLASHSIPDILQWIVSIDQHPPLYYLLLHYWIAGNGDTPYCVRLLSALLGAGTIPIIYLIGKRMSGGRWERRQPCSWLFRLSTSSTVRKRACTPS